MSITGKKLALAVAAGSVAAGAAYAQEDRQVNIYNWSDYIGETTIQDFTEATGIAVNYDTYDSNEILETKLTAGASGYDVVVPTSQPFFSRQREAGLYQKLDKSKIPNLANLDPRMMELLANADPGNEHAVIYQWGTTGIGYNVDQIDAIMPDAPVDSLSILFDKDVVSQFEQCGVALLDSPTDVIPIVLQYLGRDPNSEDPADLQAAEDLLTSIRPHIKYFHSSQYINDLASGEICLALGYSGDVGIAAARAEEAGKDFEIDYNIPNEGTLLWFDVLAIPADAPHPEAAYAWINFVLDPEVMAGITNYVTYPNAVPASLEFVDEEVKTDPDIYPPQEVMDRLFTATPKSLQYDRLRTRSWTRVKTGR